MSNYCLIDLSSGNNMCQNSDNNLSKYSEDVKLINDVIPCYVTSPSSYNSSRSKFNVEWNCNNRASCALGEGIVTNYLRRD
jgi:hypothetical protein